jgi:Helix-turn-helix domain
MAKTEAQKAFRRECDRKWRAQDGNVDRLDAARMLGVTDRTLLRWHEQSKGPPRIYAGRGIYYLIADIEAWLRTAGRSSTPVVGSRDDLKANHADQFSGS